MARSVRAALLVGVVAMLAGLALGACGGERGAAGNDTGGRLSIATGNTTGVYYQLGGGLAQVISKNLPGYQATAEATGASVENIHRVVRGDSEIGFTLADTAADAAKGTGSFTSPQPIRALLRTYTNYTQVIVRSGSGIDSVAAMRGKRVSTGSPNSGTEVIALRLLRVAGLDPDNEVQRRQLSLNDTVQAMKDGTVDAMFWSGGLPTAGVTDLTTSLKAKVRFLDLSGLLPRMQTRYGDVYEPASIAASAYGLPRAVPTIGVPNLLVVKDTMASTLAHDLTKLVFDYQPDLEKVHPEAKNIQLATAPQTAPVPLHPGSERYFREVGAR